MIIAVLPFVFHILVNAKFDDAYPLIPLYFIGSNLNILIGLISVVYIANNQTLIIAKTSLLAAIISIVSCIALVNVIGIYASPFSFIIGFGAMFLYRCADIRRYVKMNWDYKYYISFILIYLIVGIAYYIQHWIYDISAFVLASIFFWRANKGHFDIIKGKIFSRFKKNANPRVS